MLLFKYVESHVIAAWCREPLTPWPPSPLSRVRALPDADSCERAAHVQTQQLAVARTYLLFALQFTALATR